MIYQIFIGLGGRFHRILFFPLFSGLHIDCISACALGHRVRRGPVHPRDSQLQELSYRAVDIRAGHSGETTGGDCFLKSACSVTNFHFAHFFSFFFSIHTHQGYVQEDTASGWMNMELIKNGNWKIKVSNNHVGCLMFRFVRDSISLVFSVSIPGGVHSTKYIICCNCAWEATNELSDCISDAFSSFFSHFYRPTWCA